MNNFESTLNLLREGGMKGSLEDQLLEMCKPPCKGKEMIDSSEHIKSCPCKKFLKDMGY
jgi:hypothetical protein